MIRNALAFALAIFSVTTFAAEVSYLSLKEQVQQGDIYKPQGLWPFLGTSFGVMDSGNQVRSGGVPMHFKIMGSYYLTQMPIVTDLGLGLHNEFLTQQGGGSDTIQSFYTEAAARYQFTDKWQVGAIWNTLVDNPDRYRSNTENLVSFVGLQALKEFVWEDRYVVRAGGRMMTDVGISGENLNTVMAELQISFGSGQRIAKDPEPVEDAIVSTPIAPHLDRQAIQVFNIEANTIHFESESTKLVGPSRLYMKKLAQVLADNRHLFDKVEVIGHTDQRGSNTYNDRLSVQRAKAVTDGFVSAGLSQTQIISKGKGRRELLTSFNTNDALAKNRRVQLNFVGVTNQTALKNLIDSVNR